MTDTKLRLECYKQAKSDLYRPAPTHQFPSFAPDQATDEEVFARAKLLYRFIAGREWGK
jgi:hypothetical protein